MKELIFITLFFILIISSKEKIQEITKDQNLTYNGTELSYTILNTTKINEKQFNIIYEILDNSNFSSTTIKYDFFKNFNKSEIFVLNKNLEGKADKNKNRVSFEFQKDNNNNYLIMENLQSNSNKLIEIKLEIKKIPINNGKTNPKVIIPIIIISIILVIGIIVAFIFVGKYIFNKRQKEMMGNYASSFVADSPSLVPNDETSQEESTHSNVKIDE